MSAQSLGDPTAAPKSTRGAAGLSTDGELVDSPANAFAYDESKETSLWQRAIEKFDISGLPVPGAYYPDERIHEQQQQPVPRSHREHHHHHHHHQQQQHLGGYSLFSHNSDPKQVTSRFPDTHFPESAPPGTGKDADLVPVSDPDYGMVIGVDGLMGRAMTTLALPSSCPDNTVRALTASESLVNRLSAAQHDLSSEYQYFFPTQHPLLSNHDPAVLMSDFKTVAESGQHVGNLRSAQLSPETRVSGHAFVGSSEGILEAAVEEEVSVGAVLDSGHGEPGGAFGIGSQCLICGDRATGKHYGAYSCDGCKGFFRRSVRRNHSYTCRHMRMCVVTKDKRNQCRFCRLRKCFRVGMKKSAVQNERDKISTRSINYDSSSNGQPFLDLQQLMQAETQAHCALQKTLMGNFPGGQSADEEREELGNPMKQLADIPDICDSIKTQLIFLIEWAKYLPTFAVLSVPDQITLLQSHAGEMLIIGAVWRSLSSAVAELASPKEKSQTYCRKVTRSQLSCSVGGSDPSLARHCSGNLSSLPHSERLSSTASETGVRRTDRPMSSDGSIYMGTEAGTGALLKESQTNPDPDLILLGNRKIISRLCPRPEIAEVASMIFDQLYHPMQDLCLEDAEIAFLRAIIFFDPNSSGLSEGGRQTVRGCQYQLQMELMNIMNDKLYLPQGRFGALLLLLPDLRFITLKMVGKLHLATELGLTRLDGLISEILLTNTGTETNGKATASTSKSSKMRYKADRQPEQRSPAITLPPAKQASQSTSSAAEDHLPESVDHSHLETISYAQRTAAYTGHPGESSALPYLSDLPIGNPSGLSIDLGQALPVQTGTAFHPIRNCVSLSRPVDSGLALGIFDGVFGEGAAGKWSEGGLRHTASGPGNRHHCCPAENEEYHCSTMEQTPVHGYGPHDRRAKDEGVY